jgi:hypothetical protein
VATRSEVRGEERDLFRVLAAEDDTRVELGPPWDLAVTLAAGEWLDWESAVDFTITADNPILVGQLLEGSGAVFPDCDPRYDCSEVGDPTLMLLPPIGQYRSDYVFLTPDTYQHDFANVVLTEVDQTVTLDGEVVSQAATVVGEGPYAVIRLGLNDGPHRLTSELPFGLLVYGYGGNDDDFFDEGAANQ